MEELERAKDGLLCAPCDTDARECLVFQVLGRRCGEDDRRDGCSSAMYGIRIFFDALRECTRPERHSVGRVLERSGYRSRLLREPCIYSPCVRMSPRSLLEIEMKTEPTKMLQLGNKNKLRNLDNNNKCRKPKKMKHHTIVFSFVQKCTNHGQTKHTNVIITV